ncbi:MAG: EAL domain-containing protein, partial [Clostridia bacterium]|nr:EAL domain-containing protein [Clostridia bacterium]
AKASKGSPEKTFCGLGKIENYFEIAGELQLNRSIIYVSLPLDKLKRICPESKANRLYERVKRILFSHLCLAIEGEISIYGNENFVAFNYLESADVAECIERCFEDINQTLIKYGAVNVVNVRFGYICTRSTEVLFKTALSRAKLACSIADDRDDLLCQWDSSHGKDFERKLKIENSIQNEIENNNFFLEYQPILDAKTNSIIGAEVLSRLNSQTEGVIAPAFFLPAVNNVGLNKKFDYYIFEKNCKWIANDKEKRNKYVYTINFSRYTLCDPNLAQNIIEIVDKYSIDYSHIAVEIIEDKTVDDDEKSTMVNNLNLLKEKGMMILLDDFGKGYTSFGDLSDFDINIVKIDKAITQGATNQAGFVILKNIINTAHDLGFKTLCEGIETEEHKNIVIDAGCDMLQGYYFYRPMPVSKFEPLLDNKKED